MFFSHYYTVVTENDIIMIYAAVTMREVFV